MNKMAPIPEVQKQIRMTTAFGGYNHNEIITDGDMFDTQNLSADLYPVITTRKKRSIASYDVAGQDPVPLTAVHGRDELVMIRGTQVYYDFEPVTGLTVSTAQNMLPKKIISMGAYVCIWPDKVYFNTIDQMDCGSMERLWSMGGNNIDLCMCRGDGTNYDMTQISIGVTPPENPTNGKLWIDQSGENDVLRQYTASTQEWIEVPTVYVKISGVGVGHELKEYDTVNISGMAAPDGASARIKKQVAALNGSFIVYGAGEGYLIIAGLISSTMGALKNQTVNINRTVPDLDFICESNNRLWGCKYGMENGQVVNEIRASKLGDFRNWNTFMGISTDSWTASIGTDGEWTGAISQKGYPVFFKENCIHRVSGNTPNSFQITTTICRGVQRGSWRSLAIVGERILYKSRQEIMVYDVSMPFPISTQLGNVIYSDARAGAVGNLYYISMKNANDEWSLFTYNTDKEIWYREDRLKALQFAPVGDEIYAIDEEHNTLLALQGSKSGNEWTQECEFNWKAEFGLSGIEYQRTQFGISRGDLMGNHYLSRFDIRMYIEEGTKAELEIMYDSDGEWTKHGEIRGTRMKNYVLPVIPKRCDHLRFRIRGTGEIRIYSIGRYLEVGNDG